MWWLRQSQPPERVAPRETLPERNARPSNPASAGPASRDPGTVTAATMAPVPPAALLDTIRANAVPGRILFLDFILDATGLRLTGAAGAAGRAKPALPRQGFGFIHYEVFDRAGRLTASGSVEDPTRRRLEHPAASNDGRIESTVVFSEEGALSVRLAGESVPARIVLYREKNPVAGGAAAREVLGDFRLRSD